MNMDTFIFFPELEAFYYSFIDVLLFIDNIFRFTQAGSEVGLGEPGSFDLSME